MSTILVTGGNSGFGRLTAEALARRGHTVYAAMRGVDGRNADAAAEIRALATRDGHALSVVEMDVTDDGSVARGVAAVLAEAGHLDVVVNNAGLGCFGLQEAFTPEQLLELYNVNVAGPQRVNRAVLPAMRARGSGLLVHVSSTLGRTVRPVLGPYCGTKYALEALAETYRYELAPFGVDSVIVQPGAFPTAISAKGLAPADQDRADSYGPLADLPQKMGEGLGQLFSMPGGTNPQEVADAIVALIETPAGQRPLRTVVDRFDGDNTSSLNALSTTVATGILTNMGMSFMLTLRQG